jgi:hypothetical protein
MGSAQVDNPPMERFRRLGRLPRPAVLALGLAVAAGVAGKVPDREVYALASIGLATGRCGPWSGWTPSARPATRGRPAGPGQGS